jgi:hypothetical protein
MQSEYRHHPQTHPSGTGLEEEPGAHVDTMVPVDEVRRDAGEPPREKHRDALTDGGCRHDAQGHQGQGG